MSVFNDAITLPKSALSTLMPMHITLDRDGQIQSAGPTIQKLFGNDGLVGKRFFANFEIRRPRNVLSPDDLQTCIGHRLDVRAAAVGSTQFKGVVTHTKGAGSPLLLNLSFGISVANAVSVHGLTSSDFAGTDLAVEMLYLLEANAAATSETHALITRLRSAKDLAEELSITDTLTGLNNRRALEVAMQRLGRDSRLFGVMQIDLDHFKSINDTYGHAAGDYVLRHVADILTAETRSVDLVARAGGDEFIVIVGDLTEETRLDRIAQRIINRLATPITLGGKECSISASIGTAIAELGGPDDLDALLKEADMALYESKRNGRAQVTSARNAPEIERRSAAQH